MYGVVGTFVPCHFEDIAVDCVECFLIVICMFLDKFSEAVVEVG